ncbi:ATP-dependent DNA ligase [Amnibacterium flavum]|uniref:ATP-dependent DNA ligase n=2 Tax=Amnibacterium flavum TaxID=2173173 RepID=A0A2V1HXZ6_9MICO|nr:ATP-dependent DNA ligase [Amnibacterium flavum]
MRVSSPSRVIWPEAGVTKLQLVEYLVAVAPAFLRANGDRPLALERYPAGVDGEMFFSKNPPKGKPAFLREVMVTYPSARSHPQLVADEAASLVWMAQMNTVVFHPWPSRAGDIDHPDQLRIDLDPQQGKGFPDAVEAAFVLREVLDEAGLSPMIKTSGNRGVHVFTRIEPRWDFIEVRHAVIAAARALERRMPDDVTTAWWKEERGERVFVDFNQAARDRTIAGAYSPRATAGATVSMPVRWDDLADIAPGDFTVLSTPAILAERGDAWEDAPEPGVLDTLLEWWERDLANGQGEMPYPPDYPKMPGEPPRVQPSKARKPVAD